MCIFDIHPIKCNSYILELETPTGGAAAVEPLSFSYDDHEQLIRKLRSLDDGERVHSVKVVLDAHAEFRSVMMCMMPLWAKRGPMHAEIFPAKRFTRDIDERIHDEAKKRSKRKNKRHWELFGWLFGIGVFMNRSSG